LSADNDYSRNRQAEWLPTFAAFHQEKLLLNPIIVAAFLTTSAIALGIKADPQAECGPASQ